MIDIKKLNLDAVDGKVENPFNLTAIKYWPKILGFDKIIPKLILGILIAAHFIIMIITDRNSITDGSVLRNIMYILLMIYCIYLTFMIPANFQNAIIQSKRIFTREEEIGSTDQVKIDYTSYNKYTIYSTAVFKQSREFWLGLIAFIVMFIVQIVYFGAITDWYQFKVIAGVPHYFNPVERRYFIIGNMIGTTLMSLMAMMVCSAICVLFFMFDAMNQLGNERFSLDISYSDLRSDQLNQLGKQLMAITIPMILGLSLVSVIGLVNLYVFREGIIGITFIALGSSGVVLFVILLYYNTLAIHAAITKCKSELCAELLKEIQAEINKKDLCDFQKVYHMHLLYEKYEQISDWPFDPTSLRKLGLTMASSLTPIILSLFSLNPDLNIDWGMLM
jgi:hypothetical protein